MLAAILLCSLSATGPSLEAPIELDGWHFAGIPLVSYGSDVGLTLGGALFFYRSVPDFPDQHRELNVALSYATRGPRSLDTGADLRRLFRTSLRASWNVHLGDDDLMPYWGEGAQLGGLPVPSGYGTPPEPFRYHDRRIFATVTLRGAIVRALGWHLRARFLDVEVTRQSALLAESNPPGARGGRVALGEVGLWYDTRDRELDTHDGMFVNAAAFAAPELGGVSDFSFHGYHAAVQAYVPLWLGATLALRGMYDRKLAGVPYVSGQANAAVPFFERMLYEGISYNEGLGGASTIRGIARYRVSGDEKMLANVQLRTTIFTTHLFSKAQAWGLNVGLDAGRAQQPAYAAVHAVAANVGFRFIWDKAILLRVEVGRASGGENTLYVAFGEAF